MERGLEMSLISLTLKSILSRRLASVLLILSIGLSTMLMVGVQKIQESAKTSFSRSISGTDLIVGSRSGETQLLMYTVFRQGQAIANMSVESLEKIQQFPETAWTIPVSLGDSHRGYPVLGTTTDYFKHYKYSRKRTLSFASGREFQTPLEVVLGNEVAEKFGYSLGDKLVLAHGAAKGNLPIHRNIPFTIVGILDRTSTPVDKTLHIPLEGMTAIHVNWEKEGISLTRKGPSRSDLAAVDLTPSSVTGAFLGLKSKFAIFSVQQRITKWPNEPLMAIIPGVALTRMWNSIQSIDTAFTVITSVVIFIAFIGLLLALLMSLQHRKRELAIIRVLGAHPSQIMGMLILESLIITVSGVLFGLGIMFALNGIVAPYLENEFGLILNLNSLGLTELYLSLGIIGFGILVSLIPGLLAYRKSGSEGFISL